MKRFDESADMTQRKTGRPGTPDNFQRIFENNGEPPELLREPRELLRRVLMDKPVWRFELDESFQQAAIHHAHLRSFGFVSERDRAESLDYVKSEICRLESDHDYSDTPQGIYRCFDEPFERTVFRFCVARKGKILDIDPQLPMLHDMHGVLLMKMNRPLEARAAFEKALFYNPVCEPHILNRLDTFRAVGDLENFRQLTLDAFKTAFTSFQIAMLYRNLAYYFTEKKMYVEAHVMCDFSLKFDRCGVLNNILREDPLERIAEKSGRKVKKPTKRQFYICIGRHSPPLGCDYKVLSLAGRYADAAVRKRKWEDARYYLKILYDISPDSSVAADLNDLDSLLGFPVPVPPNRPDPRRGFM